MLEKRQPIQTYSVAVLISVLAIIVMQVTAQQVGVVSAFLLALVAILINAWYGGWGPGLLVALIAFLSELVLILGPTFPLRVATGVETTRFVVFALIALFINLVMLIRERTETRLREQRGLLRGTLTSIGDAVITTDNQGRITFINPVGLSLTGWSPDSALGQDLGAVLHIVDESSRVRLENPAAQVLRDGTPVEHSVLSIRFGREIGPA